MPNLELVEFVRADSLRDETMLFESFDGFLTPEDARFLAQQHDAEAKQTNTDASIIKQELSNYITSILPTIRNNSKSLSLNDVIIKHGNGDIKAIMSRPDRPMTLIHMLLSKVKDFMANKMSEAQANPELMKSIKAFSQAYGNNITDWVRKLTPIIQEERKHDHN